MRNESRINQFACRVNILIMKFVARFAHSIFENENEQGQPNVGAARTAAMDALLETVSAEF